MQLEIIHKSGSPGKKKGNIILLHGACHAAWVWENNFLDWFRTKGFNVFAMSLRAHGQSGTNKKLRYLSIRDYVADLSEVVSTVNGPVFLIGHSLGGYIIQHYLSTQQKKVSKAVLLCSVPHYGNRRLTWRICKDFPFAFLKALVTMSWLPLFSDTTVAHQLLFSNKMPLSKALQYIDKLQDESFRVFIESVFYMFPRYKNIKTPVLVIGGEIDYLFPPKDVLATARALSARAVIIKDGAHDLMLQEEWVEAASKILAFFDDKIDSD
jgi:hypothetical protein